MTGSPLSMVLASAGFFFGPEAMKPSRALASV